MTVDNKYPRKATPEEEKAIRQSEDLSPESSIYILGKLESSVPGEEGTFYVKYMAETYGYTGGVK